MDNTKKGILYAFTAVLLWATLGVSFKLAVSRLDGFVVAVYVGFFATLFLFLYLLAKGSIILIFSELKESYLFFIAVGVIGLGIQQILYIKGYQLLPASQVVIIFYLYPLLMVLLSALLFKERVSPLSLLFVLIGFIGVYIMISKGTMFELDLNTGIILTLLASLSWALFSVLIKHRKHNVEVGMFLFNLFGLFSLILLIPFFGITFDVTATELLGMAYIGIFPTAIAFLLWSKALNFVP